MTGGERLDGESLGLRAGDWVEVRSKEEILRTLDCNGRLESMPFMPGMFAYCGRRLRVAKSAHKTCDTINWTGGRRVDAAVHLEDIRCEGKGYDGCEAACLIFWKEAWLKRADDLATVQIRTVQSAAAGPGGHGGCTEEALIAATRSTAAASDGGGPTYACQATELFAASTHLAWWDVRQYLEDYRSGNADLRRIVNGLGYALSARLVRLGERTRRPVGAALAAVYDQVQSLRGGVPWPRRWGTVPSGQRTPAATLDLQPGERVRVKPYTEILATLDENNKNRGLYFDAEHVPYCGGTYRVLSRVNKIVEEKTGRMLEFKTVSIILEGVACQSRYSNCRLFCPRAIHPYWRGDLARACRSQADLVLIPTLSGPRQLSCRAPEERRDPNE